MHTIALINSKGGVGKTTTSVTLAAGLAGAGKRVVIVDTDPQGNVAKWFGMPEESGVFDLLVKERHISELLRLMPREQWWPTETEGALAILPGNTRTTTAGVTLAVERSPANVLRKGLSPLAGYIDVVILDTSPTVTELMANVFVATDYAIIPTETRILSVNGVIKTIERIKAVQDQIDLEIIGILPTKHVARQVECQENMQTLQDLYGDLVWPAIGQRTAWSELPSFGRSMFAYATPRHKAAKEAAALIETFNTVMAAKGVPA